MNRKFVPGRGDFANSLGASDMAQAVAQFDWSSTPLGPIEQWPVSCKTAVSMILRAPMAITLLWGVDAILIFNDAYARIAGTKRSAGLGQSAFTIWPEVADFNRNVVKQVLAGESLSYRDQELILNRDDGPGKAFRDLDYSPVIDESGSPVAVLATVVETTGHKLASEHLKNERERFLFEQSPTFMAVLRGAEHRFEMANPGYDQIVGHREVIGKTVAEALPEAVAQGYITLLDQVFESGEAYKGIGSKFAVQATPGGPVVDRYLDFVYQPIRDSAGKVTGIFVQGADVSDRVHADTTMRAVEERNRQILDSAVDYAIIAFDLNGKVTRWNKGAQLILGWTEVEMLGQDASRFFTPEDRSTGQVEKEMQNALTKAVGNDERWHVRKSGERFWASGELTVLRDDSGRAAGFVKVLRDRTEAHRAGQALVESEGRLRRAQEAGGVGTFTVDIGLDRVFGTDEFYRTFGLAKAESYPAGTVELLVIAEDRELMSSRATRNSKDARLDVEYRIRRADNQELRWISRKAEFERDQDGSIARMVGVVQDITERKAAIDAVAESAAQFRTLAEAAPNHVWTSDADGHLDWFNQRTYQYSGAEPGQLDGTDWASIVHPEDLAVAAARWESSLQTGHLYETEFRIRRADGEFRWHLVRALPLKNSEGAVVRWVGTNTDIHEGKLAQAESARDRNRIWALSQEFMLVCDFEGTITDVNPSAERILGWPAETMVGKFLSDFLHPEDVAKTAAEVAKLAAGRNTIALENRYRHKDGSYRLLAWTAVPEGGFIHAVARDITRERSTEEALRQSQKLDAIGQLTGGVAHDFNNVLAVISNSVEVLKRLSESDERRPRFIDAISKSVARATKLTGQLLAFARRQALQPMVFDAGQNTRAVSEMIQSLAGVRIEVVLKLSERACFINADPSQFDTALVNLAVNARDAMAEQGTLTVEVFNSDGIPAMALQEGVKGDFVAIAIGDTGTGIAPEHLNQIFEPFFTTKAVGVGTGLGLSQVFGFAKQSGGDIRVESTLGKGSRFTLYLPRAQRPGDAPDEQTDRLAPTKGSGCVLVVEDNPEVAASVRETLEVIGYSTLVVPSAEAALLQLRQDANRFVAVFSDVVMTGMSGIELAWEIHHIYGALPVVLTSGYSYVLAQESDHDFTLLPKPYSVDDLAHVLHQVIHQSRGGYRARRAALPAGTEQVREAEMESGRLAELAALQIMDTPAEAAYDEITRLAAKFCDAPIALITLVDDKRQWFKAKVGLQAEETPREVAFCAHAIQTPDHVMIVKDASLDPRFSGNPLVTGDPNIRFYAGAPLVTSNGQPLGTLCVIDTVPREIDAKQLEVLQFLANQVIEHIEKPVE